MKTAVISPPAFLNMVISSIEVYKKESYGIIVGEKKTDKYKINYAVNFQSAKRHYDYIEMNTHRINRINNILKYLVNKEVIGDFHSHSDWPSKLSKYDIKELEKEGTGYLSLLLLVQDNKRKQKWKYKDSHTLACGSLGDFFVTISGMEIDSKTGKPIPVKIKILHMKNLNKIARYNKAEE